MSESRPGAEIAVPPALFPGARVRVIAPSSPFDRTLFFRGVGWLGERYRVSVGAHALERAGFLAGSDSSRLADLDEALADPELHAIVAARGGYGAGRIAHLAHWSALRQHPKWLVGFSDVTLLHIEAARVGVASLHAENAAGLGRGDARARAEWIAALEQPWTPRDLQGSHGLGERAEGVLVGGNLTMLFTAQAAGRLTLPKGAILAIEDVTEAPYRVDRMLTALRIAGVFEHVSGVVVGDFTDCAAGRHGVAVEAVLEEQLRDLGVPVLFGVPFGHGRPNAPLPLGMRAELDVQRRRLRVGLR